MILTYRQRLIIHNLIDAKLTEIENAGLSLNDDCEKLMIFKNELLGNDEIIFKSNKVDK